MLLFPEGGTCPSACGHCLLTPSLCLLSIQPAGLVIVLPNLLHCHLISEGAILRTTRFVVPVWQVRGEGRR